MSTTTVPPLPATGQKVQPKTRIRQAQEFAAHNTVTSVLGCMGVIVLIGTIFSLLWNTSLHTSSYTAPVPLHRSTLFANKNNFLNLYFVKLSWLWTCTFYTLHSLDSFLPSRTPRRRATIRRALKILIASGTWVLFNWWLNATVFEYSGGECLLQLPDSYPTLSAIALPQMGTRDIYQGYGGSQWLPVSKSLCDSHRPIPEGILASLAASAADDSLTQKLAILKASKRGGFDISGHIFILILSTALIWDDLAPGVRTYLRHGMRGVHAEMEDLGWFLKRVHLTVKGLGVFLVGLWTWMILITSVYFHSPSEKFSGFVVAFVGSWAFKLLSDLLTPLGEMVVGLFGW